jgi:hypothetical protein
MTTRKTTAASMKRSLQAYILAGRMPNYCNTEILHQEGTNMRKDTPVEPWPVTLAPEILVVIQL